MGQWLRQGSEREDERGEAARRVHWSGSSSTSTARTAWAPWPEPVASRGAEKDMGAVAVGRRAPTRRRSAVASVHQLLLNEEGRTGEREREVRRGNSPRVRCGWWRSSERRWRFTVRNDGGALSWSIRGTDGSTLGELGRA
jgi:hypothetical protein